ncbi:MAG: WbqC family protein [Flavobacterium sp.]
MKTIIYPTYFPSIAHFSAVVNSQYLELEVEDNFQKQSYRNRCLIYSPNGVQLLNVPVVHSKNIRQKTKDVKISYDFDWQKQHFKSLEMAYRSSPFFEFYESEFEPLFQKKTKFLLDLNIEIFELLLKCLLLKKEYSQSVEFFKNLPDYNDYRYLTQDKKTNYKFEPYTQVFEDKFGFINNLSVIDLIFAEGKYAVNYLENIKIL